MKKKLLFGTLLLICLLLLPSLTVAATETADHEETTGAVTDTPSDTPEEEAVPDSTDTPGLGQLLLDGLEAYTPEIFSAMALISSLLLLLGYKRGFLPLLRGGLGKLCGAVHELGAQTEAHRESADGLVSDVSERIQKTEGHLANLGETLRLLEEKLPNAEKTSALFRQVETVLLSQIDMLYELFLSTSLPQYRKDAIGEKVSTMRAALQTDRTAEKETEKHES